MKKLIFIIILISTGLLFAALEPVMISTNQTKAYVKLLNSLDISIDKVNSTSIIVYVNEKQFKQLQDLGMEIIEIPNEAKIYAQQLWEETKYSDDPMNAYYTINEYHTFMQDIANQYPNICQLINAGNSVQGRPIYFLKISDNPTIEENEPEIRLSSSIHGDEVVGYDMLIRLISLITSGYGTDDRLTSIVDNTELWINPMTNPDGYVLIQRANANGVDLNRSFPDFSANDENTAVGREPEIAVLKNFADNHSINQSLNFHGGELVINYPWDAIYTLHPDNDVMVDLSLTYAMENPSLYNSTDFVHGITNGAAWYVVHGSMQDWLNAYYTCMDLTAEISLNKWPAANTLDTFWGNNRESMLKFIEKAQKGLHGTVLNAENEPLLAQIEIENRVTSTTDPQVGDFHRYLLAGSYNLTIKSYGYETQTMNNVTISNDTPTVINVVLNPLPSIIFKGYVKDLQGAPLQNATVTIETNQLQTVQTNISGYFEISGIFPGDYNITVQSEGFMPYQTSINILADLTYNFTLSPPSFIEEFDNGLALWTVQTPWAISNVSTNNVLQDSPTGNYANNINKSAKITDSFDLTTSTYAIVTYDLKNNLENAYDFLYFEISNNNTNWTTLKTYTGVSDWRNEIVNLSQYLGQNVYLRFRIKTDQNTTADGVSIDNVCFNNQNAHSVDNENNVIHHNPLRVSHYPNPVYMQSKTAFVIDSPYKNANHIIDIYNIKGQKVRSLNQDAKNPNRIEWNKKDEHQNILSSGIYFYRIRNEGYSSSFKKLSIIN